MSCVQQPPDTNTVQKTDALGVGADSKQVGSIMTICPESQDLESWYIHVRAQTLHEPDEFKGYLQPIETACHFAMMYADME